MDRIRCIGVRKQFSRGGAETLVVRKYIWPWKGSGLSPWFWALDGVDLAVSGGGKRVGIIGDNGSGKTTLLRIIAGVTRPTHGTVVVHGRVVPLLELGAGMHPDLTGRENVYLNGILLGMRRSEVRRKFDQIVEFAGVTEFLDMPLKHYSMGMIMRLGFSVAIHVDAEILLVDEAWGVGDVGFQAKTMEQMRLLRDRGVSSLLVSHDANILRQLTDEILWLQSGRVAAFGPTESVINAYLAATSDRGH